MLSGFFQNQASTLGTLPSNTIPNPKGEMKAITTRSGVAYEGPSIPTNPSPKKVVERETEETTIRATNFPRKYQLTFAPMIRNLLMNKEKLLELAKIPLNENVSVMLLKKLPENLGDPGKFLIPCNFPGMDVYFESRVPPAYLSDNFGEYFLRTDRALIDVYGEEITLRVDNEAITFNLDQTTRYFLTNDKSVNRIDIIDEVCEEYAPELLGFSNKSSGGNPTPTSEPLTSEFILEEIEAYLKDDSISPEINHADCDPEGDIFIIIENYYIITRFNFPSMNP
ncbi:hypothetical protein Tco_0599084 [Tanacetum coccineum]